jgi:hypothetical protein
VRTMRIVVAVTLAVLLLYALITTVMPSASSRALAEPELPVKRVAQIASGQANRGGEISHGPVVIEILRCTLLQADALTDITPNALEAREQRNVYLVLMRGEFHYHSTPAGTEPPPPGWTTVPNGGPPTSATTLELILDTQTGSLEDMGANDESPARSKLKQDQTPSFIDVAGTISPLPATDGQVEGSINHGSSSAEWTIIIKHHQTAIATTKTVGYGNFYFLLPANAYRLTVRKPNGKTCASRTMTVKAREETRLQLTC